LKSYKRIELKVFPKTFINFKAPSFNEVINNKYIKDVIFKDKDFHQVLLKHLPEG